MKYELVTVTQEMAREWLERNGHNRPLSPSQVKYFERQLKSGKAATTHQGIARDTNGNVHDGQHRLTAIRNTGISWTMWVASDCLPEDFNKIDRNKVRSIADLLHIHGHKNSKHVGAVGKLAWNWYHGNAAFSGKPDDQEIHDLIEQFPSLEDVPRITIQGCGVVPALMSFLCYIGPEGFVEEFQLSAEGLGEPTADSSAARLAAKYRRWHSESKRITPKLALAWFILAANDQVIGREPRSISYRETQQFPKPVWAPPIPFEAVIDADDEE